MTEQLRQSLSAVVDSEADAFELRRVLDELERDPALRASWMRYHLIGSVIRGEHQALEGQTADRLGRPLRVEPHTTLMPLTMAAASPVDDGRGPVDRRRRARHSDANSDARADLRRWPGFRGRAAPISALTALAGVFALASAALFTGAGDGHCLSAGSAACGGATVVFFPHSVTGRPCFPARRRAMGAGLHVATCPAAGFRPAWRHLASPSRNV